MKNFVSILTSPILMTVLILVFGSVIAIGTFVESRQSTEIAWQLIYNTRWFDFLMILGALNLSLSVFTRKLYKREKLSVFLFHIAFVIIILGAGITRYFGLEGTMQIREGGTSNTIELSRTESQTLPFSLYLTDFIIDYYPGSENPMGFESKVILTDKERAVNEERRIYMNNILKYRGYRFYQSSYHEDMKGTVLSVSRDRWGTLVTYIGYFLLTLGMLWSLLNKNSRFIRLLNYKSVLIVLLVSLSSLLNAQENDSLPVIPQEEAELFGQLLVRDEQGRTKPVNTLAEDIFRKVHRKMDYHGQTPMQVLLGMYVYPEQWQNEPLLYAGKRLPEILELSGKRVSLQECYVGQGFFISSMDAIKAYRIPPSQRSKAQNDLIRFDERLNILYHWFGGGMLTIFPSPSDSTTKWYNPLNVGEIQSADTVFLQSVLHLYFSEIRKSMQTGNWGVPRELVLGIANLQVKYGDHLPSDAKVKLETSYYKLHIFKRISNWYLLLGLVLLALAFIKIFKSGSNKLKVEALLVYLIIFVLIIHTVGMAMRWYISGHAPWSNAYETMIFIAWSGVLAGILFARRNIAILAVSAILAWIYLYAGHMSWMDPQITNLVPVLRSKWLVIHVAVITSSYGFLGVGSMMAFLNIVLMIFQNPRNFERSQESISGITRIIEIALISGLYLLSIGTFLGAVWANESWGRYWAWDPKETWALITILVYALVLHLRLIPSLKNELLFNFMALISYAAVLMTYFGVNYYLSGLHSYASGDAAPIPKTVFYTLGGIIIITYGAATNRWILKKKQGKLR
jgi:cytochrome c-type biogenesis protein CcsB